MVGHILCLTNTNYQVTLFGAAKTVNQRVILPCYIRFNVLIGDELWGWVGKMQHRIAFGDPIGDALICSCQYRGLFYGEL